MPCQQPVHRLSRLRIDVIGDANVQLGASTSQSGAQVVGRDGERDFPLLGVHRRDHSPDGVAVRIHCRGARETALD
jgi:hypothetical protein